MNQIYPGNRENHKAKIDFRAPVSEKPRGSKPQAFFVKFLAYLREKNFLHLVQESKKLDKI
ncbi:MAG: hypothetical protein A3B74_01520 [Candidatus Kerfeldbacteria bacterium RIFCSPHIGHO2_02_FULL_42_14]|uniref:Uncharacterized protein n=1 Tax=Candidatus Kerfeldbacteria bacterium RIFCSPHIGHO2_02_FULL_42_14 TaxID=1798540 RepID=A0A1G2ASN0_9BACT|nr:MAG: hypothetical protein A3B74_01520 [Candidatus Kerfeldbacteria bacterium RIFCSPHIGHO2_02_FULL_42_14]OGY82297.1 MAG: hypothetical protein A3E60_03720 [Candidatus Kerfeldbacteria bacterium RIFCSPHIGHO2_12_FULL_42_13]OGY84725.1 MAG: hypothetical protein A3I91_05520 [Candidatus Kerfeldbacteria bacterium RIFCSPLOWO2_02_FULL_42_19]OGY85956.1 MAG: hypothetical protein A3G01_03425 [Candidatus Kerfeldbacteria bacterium RIFCSPLOWO2_12_FULL_43_9]